jgi:hypothetical protein
MLLFAISAPLDAQSVKLGDGVSVSGSIRMRSYSWDWFGSGDYAYNPRVSIGGYFGDAVGHAVAQSIYGTGTHIRFAYAELLVRF